MTKDKFKTLVVGHRGGYLKGVENSLTAVQAAIDNHLEAIEIDVSKGFERLLQFEHGDPHLDSDPDSYLFDVGLVEPRWRTYGHPRERGL